MGFSKRLLLLLLAMLGCASAQMVHVTGRVQISGKKGDVKNASEVVVWLVPLSGHAPPPPVKQYRLVQQNKQFEPHILVIPVGAEVEFPNKDPFFHNVFSVYQGKPFDLGLYESGTSKEVRFDRPGPSFIFCNIHPEMSAVILALNTPYHAMTNPQGEYSLEVPEGEYELGIWYERSRPEDLKRLAEKVTIGPENAEIKRIRLSEAPSLAEGHKNKYGQTYEETPRYPLP